ncbi:hypothetical protein AYL41_07035 [Listeria monocytogenes]|uniref:Uncharacterized protein n=1 Tax=Listeria monocytogenes TaxID=1639 RepID=A0A6X4QRE1_LISMN|nr:hypothetical protein [Listeria monocytogenes]EAD6806331.1 hypothetical protein [Listeria monocytogenes]EAF2116104.1 hypothetical protein [Listeria monocytogenes]EAF8202753.1 hypothetical protein [Listeria monocytogenes]EAG4303147.1 hypothetical protein [Listeria monocytogenes]
MVKLLKIAKNLDKSYLYKKTNKKTISQNNSKITKKEAKINLIFGFLLLSLLFNEYIDSRLLV